MCASASMASRVHPTLNQGMLEFCFPSEQLQIEMYFSSIQGPLLLDGWQGAVTRSLLKIIDREEALTVLGIAFCLGSLLRPGVFCHGVFLTKIKKCDPRS